MRKRDPRRRCTAKNRQGKRCGSYAIPGGQVCRLHGGGAPQVLKKARERLLESADSAAYYLSQVINDEKVDPGARIRAAGMILDRSGHGPRSTVDLPGLTNLAARLAKGRERVAKSKQEASFTATR